MGNDRTWKCKKRVVVPLYCLAAFFIAEICLTIVSIVRPAPMSLSQIFQYLNLSGQKLVYYLVDFHTLANVLFIVLLFLCADRILKYEKGRVQRQDFTRKDISGVGGWMIIPAIRNIAMLMLYTLMFIFSVFASLGVEELIGDRGSAFFTVFHWDFTLMLLFMAVVSLLVVITMFKKGFAFRPIAIAMESMAIFINGFYALNLLVLRLVYGFSIKSFLSDMGTQGFAVIASILFVLYYLKSDRVKNTYKRNPD